MNGLLFGLAAMLALLSISACGSRDRRAEEASSRFAQAYAAGDYQAARIAISEALAARDDVAAYWIDLGRTNSALAQYEGAFAAYQRALELDPNNLEALQNIAELYVTQRDFRRAERTAAQIVQISPDDPHALLVRGFIALAREQPAVALATAEHVLARFPGDDSATLLKARALAQSDRRPEAIQLLETSLRVTGPTQPKLAALRDFYTAENQWPGLKLTFQRLLQLAPDDNNLRLEFARAAFRGADPATGNEQAARILRSNSSQTTLFDGVADLLIENRNVSLGGPDLQRLAEGAGPAARLALARVAIEKGLAPLGSRILQPLLAGPMTSTKASATGLQALSLLSQGNAGEAARLADEALEFDETDLNSLLARARAALALRRLDDALGAAQMLAREDPAHYQTLLAQVYRARGNEALARSLFARAAAAAAAAAAPAAVPAATPGN